MSGMPGEFELIDQIRTRLGGDRARPYGIGDDGAVLTPEDGDVVATDIMVEGVHFTLDYSSWADVGYKLVASNVSDIFAMGASPTAALLQVALPVEGMDVAAFVDGIAEAMAELAPGAPLVGGDTTRSPDRAMLGMTWFGDCRGLPWTRDAAAAGMRVYLVGEVGKAAAGLAYLDETIPRSGASPAAIDECVGAHRRPRVPKRVESPLLRREPVACIDVSDGLASDILHVARASNVHVEITEQLPGSRCLSELGLSDARALELQLGGGDDYARVIFTSVDVSQCAGVTAIGRVVEGEPGLTLRKRDGSAERLDASGFRHF